MTTTRGTVFGFEILSELGFTYTRSGGGMPLHVVENDAGAAEDPGELLIEWKRPQHPFAARLYREGAVTRLWVEGAGWFVIDPIARRIEIPPHGGDAVRREERLWGIPVLLCFLARGELPLHAAAIEVEGGAILVSGQSRAGKTTLAAAFARRGYRVLSEDLSCIRLAGQTSVLPGPAMLRLRLDAAARVRIPTARAVATDADRVHLALDKELRGTADPVPLRSVFLLTGGRTRMSVKPVETTKAISDLWSLSFRLPTDEDRTRCFSGVVELAQRVPVYEMARRPSYDGLDAVIDAIVTRTPVHV